jgi:hypothetical protein
MESVPRILAFVSVFVVMWDYKWLEGQRIPGSHVEGLSEYRELQLIVLLMRFAAWGMSLWLNDAVLKMWASALLGILSLFVGPHHS